MVFSRFSKKSQPGYCVKGQVLLVLTACTCTPPPTPQRKCREGQEQKAKMDAHDDDDDDGNENIAKDEFCVLSNFINICQMQAISPGVESRRERKLC